MYSKRLGAATPLPLISFADNGSVFCSWSLLIKRDQWQLVLFIWQLSGRIRKKLHAVSTARVCLQKCPATCATISRPLQVPCPDDQVHGDVRYSDPSSVWVLICSIIVFFMVK